MSNTNCNFCNFCNFCNSCNSCDACYTCNFCNFCKNLKMTEYNYFCWSEKYNDENSFQQNRYRIFNVEVSREEYYKTKKLYRKLDFDENESYATIFQTAFKKMWYTLTKEEKQEYFDIPHFSWEWFTFITGIEKETRETINIGWLLYDKNEVEKKLKDIKPL